MELEPAFLYHRYKLVEFPEADMYAFALYSFVWPAQQGIYFYTHTPNWGLLEFGHVVMDDFRFSQPISELNIHTVKVGDEHLEFEHWKEYWMEESREWDDSATPMWGFINEYFRGYQLDYDQYLGVVIPYYDGVNQRVLQTQHVQIGPGSVQELNFAVFGQMFDVWLNYQEHMEAPIQRVSLGTIENALVVIDTHLPGDMSYVGVQGIMVNKYDEPVEIRFSLDDMRDLEEFPPIVIAHEGGGSYLWSTTFDLRLHLNSGSLDSHNRIFTDGPGMYGLGFQEPIGLGVRNGIEALVFPASRHQGAWLSADLTNFTEITMEMWIYLEDWGPTPEVGFGRILTDKDNDPRFFMLVAHRNPHYNDNSLVVGIGDYVVSTQPNSLSLQRWHHIAFIHDGQTPVILINGIPQRLATFIDTDPAFVPPLGKDLLIGNSTQMDRRFHGAIEQIRIVNWARTKTEIQSEIQPVLEKRLHFLP